MFTDIMHFTVNTQSGNEFKIDTCMCILFVSLKNMTKVEYMQKKNRIGVVSYQNIFD